MRIHRRLLNRGICRKLISLALVGSLLPLPGCTTVNPAGKDLTYVGEPACLEDYEGTDLEIDHPDVNEPLPERVAITQKPRRLGDRSRDDVWDLSLEEAIHMALANNKIIRTRGGFRTPGEQIYSNPNGVPSTLDPAIRDSGVLFGGRGVEAALASFDTNFTTNMTWGHNSQIINNVFLAGGLPEGSVLNQDTGTFTTGLSKVLAYGAQVSIAQNWNYLWTDQPAQLFPSVYTGNAVLNYSQPLWAGSGADFTRIAGPLQAGLQGVTGVNQGVVIARINTDIALADFEISVRNMLKDTEDIYWDLYLAYRTYDTNVEARNSFLRSWRFAYANKGVGKFSDLDEAQAREAYFEGRVAAENALQDIYRLETELRRLCGLPSADGRIIRPSDDPTTAEMRPDWNICLAEALTRREELRRQKWNLKSLELQLTAAENLAHPQLNFVSSYQLNGFGNNLFTLNSGGSQAPNEQSAYGTLFHGAQRGWTMGLQFNLPLGLRSALSQVRNYELQVAKAREVLAYQEMEICHELTTTFQNLAWRYQTAQTNFNRWQIAEAQVPGRENRYKTGVPGIDTSVLLDQWLQARRRAATAEVTFYTSVIEYNKVLNDLRFRKGTLLEDNNVHLQEGAWTPEAYKDALRRAWARTFAIDAFENDPVHAEPENFQRNSGDIGVLEFMGSQQSSADPTFDSMLPPESPEPEGIRGRGTPLTFPAPPAVPPAPAAEGDAASLPAKQLPLDLPSGVGV
ncbi:MAG: TolC family protein [Planctomycetaceae bacterium]|nr:TolC family protein [Planctomycetaceae bacterium]